LALTLSGNPAPNGNSGVSLFGGTTNNTIEANTIRYNQYQDVLISGAGTSNNTVQINTIWGGADVSPPVGYDNAGVVINNGATNNRVEGNDIAYHVFDGVQVVGPGTDDNVIGGNQVSANGRGVVVINDYSDAVPPDPDAPPFDLQTDSFTAPGPARTHILGNLIIFRTTTMAFSSVAMEAGPLLRTTILVTTRLMAFVSSAPHLVLRAILSLVMPRTGFTRLSSSGKMTHPPLQTMTCSPSPPSGTTS
jgi:hypothetical protein